MINPKVTPGKPQIRIGNYHGHRYWSCTIDGNITAWGPTIMDAYKQWLMTQKISADARIAAFSGTKGTIAFKDIRLDAPVLRLVK